MQAKQNIRYRSPKWFAYSGYLTSSGKCPNAQSEFIHAAANQHGPDEREQVRQNL